MHPVTILARAIVAGGLAGARPALALVFVQLMVRGFANADAIPEGFGWLVHEYAIAVVAALAVLEHFIRTDPDLETLLEIPNAVVSVVIAASMPVLLGATESLDAPGNGGGAAPPGAQQAGLPLLRAGLPADLLGLEGLKILSAVGAAALLFWVRRKIMAALGAISLSQRYFRWAETGLVVGAMTVLLLLPALAVLLAAIVILGSAGAGAALWLLQRRRDDERRLTCPACGHRAREEARVCPKCQAALEPRRKLGQPLLRRAEDKP